MTVSLANFDSYSGYYAQLITNQTPPEPAFMREFYQVLFAYYQQNGLYDFLQTNLSATRTTSQSLKPLRNPAWRVVEFYVSKIFPGKLPDALPIETENENIIEPIHQIWNWSNFSSVKQKWIRWFAIYGDLFVKIVSKGQPASSIYMSIIRPEHVTDFEVDERGFLTFIRIDVPTINEDGVTEYVHTEVWNKAAQEVLFWRHDRPLDTKLEELPSPDLELSFEETHGEDFIPIVYQAFRDDGEGRANGAYVSQLDKIDEANRQATRLAQILFRYNKAFWAATSSGQDASGRPLPPINLSNLQDSDSDIITMGDDDIVTLPSMSELKPLVPDINYADALEILNASMTELTKDLPELAYYELRGMGEISGRAIAFLLDDMISRVKETRGNAESALERIHQMALTIGKNYNLFDESIGTFENGDFVHGFTERPILPEDFTEKAETIRALTQSGASLFGAAKFLGYSDERASELSQVDLIESFGLQR